MKVIVMRFGSLVLVLLAALNGACTADTRPTADAFELRDRTATIEDETEGAAEGGEVLRRAARLGETTAPALGLEHADVVLAEAPDVPRP